MKRPVLGFSRRHNKKRRRRPTRKQGWRWRRAGGSGRSTASLVRRVMGVLEMPLLRCRTEAEECQQEQQQHQKQQVCSIRRV